MNGEIKRLYRRAGEATMRVIPAARETMPTPACRSTLGVSDRETTTLPAVSRVMLSACRIGTPEVTRVPRVRLNRAIAVLRWMSPMIGNLSVSRSIRRWKRRWSRSSRYDWS